MKVYLFFALFILFARVIKAQTVNYRYDSMGRLTQVIYPDSSIIKYAYDAAGNRVRKAVIQSPTMITCSLRNISFFAGSSDNTKNYQWKVNTGNGFIDISNDAIYSGATTNVLTLTNAPSSLYGYKYQCVISDGAGSATTAPNTIKFATTWVGTSSTAWENTDNWGCKVIPDENTDVIIPIGLSNNPVLSTNASVRSIQISNGSALKVNTGYNLFIKGLPENK
ncbi:MAG: hypothetical protein JWQ09_3451 [Segetibacter sp.]|nr:hypothetical protein [Segetibacter sp.]